MGYSFDTCAFVEGWDRSYPPDLFPSLWAKIEQLIDAGILVASEEVMEELGKKNDDVLAWAKERRHMFRPLTEEIQKVASEILLQEKFARLVDSRTDRSRADPFVIALAKVEDHTVVTEEKNFGTPSRPRIPIVCKHFGIPCIKLLQFIREQGWKF